MRWRFPELFVALATGLILLASPSSRAAATVDYEKQIKPVLKARCFSCHGALKQEGGLRLDTGKLIRKGGDSGAAIAAGKPDESFLIERISDPDESSRMPPEGKPLSPDQIELFRKWIAAGATSPADENRKPILGTIGPSKSLGECCLSRHARIPGSGIRSTRLFQLDTRKSEWLLCQPRGRNFCSDECTLT